MLKKTLFLQLFAEGGASDGSATSDGFTGSETGGAEADKSGGEPSVIYGKQNTDSTTESDGDTTDTPQKLKSFDDLIKGEYKDDFEKKTQAIINKRFKETKSLEESLKSHESILSMLADKYGVDADDIKGLQNAIEEDDSFYEQEAFEKGLTIKQLKEFKRLERENEAFKQAEEEAEARQHTEQIYAKWVEEAEELKTRYGLENFSLEEECQNPDFVRLLQSGISVDASYKACHMDDMISGAMVKTANVVKEGLANSLQNRGGRPSENGLSASKSSQIFKSDPSKLTNEDLIEIRRQVMGGAKISW